MTAHLHRTPTHRPWWAATLWLALVGSALVIGAALLLGPGDDRPRPAGVVHTTPAAPARADLLVTPAPWPTAASRCCARTALPGARRP